MYSSPMTPNPHMTDKERKREEKYRRHAAALEYKERMRQKDSKRAVQAMIGLGIANFFLMAMPVYLTNRWLWVMLHGPVIPTVTISVGIFSVGIRFGNCELAHNLRHVCYALERSFGGDKSLINTHRVFCNVNVPGLGRATTDGCRIFAFANFLGWWMFFVMIAAYVANFFSVVFIYWYWYKEHDHKLWKRSMYTAPFVPLILTIGLVVYAVLMPDLKQIPMFWNSLVGGVASGLFAFTPIDTIPLGVGMWGMIFVIGYMITSLIVMMYFIKPHEGEDDYEEQQLWIQDEADMWHSYGT